MYTNSNTLRVIDIVDGTIVDGPGFRTTIYFAGCHHHCPGCHNQHTWDFEAGKPMSVGELMARIIDNDMNVTLSGGDPLYQMEPIIALCREIKAAGKTVWCYTGFTYEEIIADPELKPILQAVDVIVDGRFVMALRDTTLRFRGSKNQRIIDVSQSREGKIVEWEPEKVIF